MCICFFYYYAVEGRPLLTCSTMRFLLWGDDAQYLRWMDHSG